VGESRANRHRRACTRKIALRLGFRLTTAASVTFTIQRVVRGRLVNGSCVKQTRKNHHHHRCIQLVGVRGSLARTASAGANTFVFDGKIGGRRLGPGSYLMTVIPAANRQNGTPQRTTFRILP
jgi:hypothetical protein